MADVFAEIDEAMRQEKMAKLWHEHKVLFITFIAAIIIGTASMSSYRAWNTHVKTSQTEIVLEMLEAENYPTNVVEQTKLRLRPGLRGIALMNAAGTFMEQGKKDQALALYQRTSQDKAIPAEMRDLATLMSLRLITPEAATALPQLDAIITNKKSPWRYHAMLEAATIHAHRQQDYAAAIALLNAVQDTADLPDTLYKKARALAHIYQLKQDKQQSKTAS